MSTLSKPSVGPISALPGSLRSRRVMWPWIAGGVALLGVGAYFLSISDWFSRLFRAEQSQAGVYSVASATLSIALSVDGELKPKDQNEIKNEVEGQSTILSILPESTRVKKGDLIVELASDQLVERLETEKIELRRAEAESQGAAEDLEITRNQNASDLKKAQLDLEVAELELRKYLEGDYQKELKTLQIEVERSALEVKRKQDELAKQEKLLDKGFVTTSKLEELRFELRNLIRAQEKNELALEILNEYDKTKNEKQKRSDAERASEELERVRQRGESKEKQAVVKLEQAQATLQVRQTRLARLNEQVAKCKIIAPADGMIQYPTNRWGWDEYRPAQGQKVQEGQTMVVLPDTSQMIVSTRIHEADRHRVKEGMSCIVRVAAVPGRSFTGKVSKIARFADSANRWINPDLKEHATEILLDTTDAPLSPGDSAEIKILIEDVPNALAVPVQAVHARGKKNFVFVQHLTGAEPAEVTIGRSTTTMIEITKGLQAGDRVLLKSDERLEAKLPAVNAGAKDEDRAHPAETSAPSKTAAAESATEPAVPAADVQPAASEPSDDAASESQPTSKPAEQPTDT